MPSVRRPAVTKGDPKAYTAVIVWADDGDFYRAEDYSICSVCGGKLPALFTRCRRCVARP